MDKRVVPVAATVHQIAAALNKLYELSPEQLKLTTVIESSRGLIAGVKKNTRAPAGIGPVSAIPSPTQESDLDEEKTVQNLTERAMSATPAAALDFEEEGIEAADHTQSSNLSADDIAEANLNQNSAAAASSNTTDTSTSASPEVDLFAELSSPEVLGGSTPKAAVTASTPEPIDLSPGDVAFFDGPDTTSTPQATNIGTSNSSASGTADALPGLDDLLAEPTPSDLPTLQANDSLDTSAAESLDASADSDLGSLDSLDASLDSLGETGSNDLRTDSSSGTDLLATNTGENMLTDNFDLDSFELAENSSASKPEQSALPNEVQLDEAENTPQDAYLAEESLVPGLSAVLEESSEILPTHDALPQETIRAAEELLASTTDFSESLADADAILAGETLAPEDVYTNVEDDSANLSEVSEADDNHKPTAGMSELSQSELVSINAAVNASLVKLAMAGSQKKAFEILNQKLQGFEIKIELESPGVISLTHREAQITISFSELENQSATSQLTRALHPVLKKLEKLK